MRVMWMCVASLCVALAVLCLPRPVAAQIPDQPYQSNGRVKGFPIVYVTDAFGGETKGKLLSWVGSEIVLAMVRGSADRSGECGSSSGFSAILRLIGWSIGTGGLIASLKGRGDAYVQDCKMK